MDMNLRTICPCLAAALLAACAPRTPDVTTEPFGTLSTGEPVTLYRLSSGTGSSMEVIDYGCRVVRICVPDRNGRIDDVVVFNALNMTNIEPIVDLQLEEVRDRLADRRITLDVTPAAMEHLSIDGYDPIFGARPLKRLIQREIVDRIAEKVVQGTLRDRSHVLIDINAEGDYECTVEEPLDLDSITLDAEPVQ